MRSITRSIILLALVASVLVADPPCVFACSCVPPGAPREELTRSAAVFAGKVVRLDVPGGAVISSADPVKVTFQVAQVWKGPVAPTLVITTPRDSASCGVGFEQGGEYLVYASGDPNALTAILCSRTQQLSTAQADLAALGTGQQPAGTPQTPSELPDTGTDGTAGEIAPGLVASLVLGGVGLGLLFAATRTTRKRSARRSR